MEYHIAKPSLLLSGFIKHYWTMENCHPQKGQHVQRIIPSGLLELMFYPGDRPTTNDKTKSINANAFVTGHLSEFYDIQISGKLSLFSIVFKPHGLSMFLNLPINELYNQNVPLKYLLKQEAAVLETRMYEAKSFNERIKIFENHFIKQLQKSSKGYYYKRLDHTIHLINQTRGVVGIDFLASQACFSRKQFERIFLQYVGISPKQFLKVIRFQHAIDKKSRENSIELGDLVYLCGYYDQSHMIYDFQKFAGFTPKKFFKACDTYSDYFH